MPVMLADVSRTYEPAKAPANQRQLINDETPTLPSCTGREICAPKGTHRLMKLHMQHYGFCWKC